MAVEPADLPTGTSTDGPEHAAAASPLTPLLDREPLSRLESWELDEELLHMQRLLHRFDGAAVAGPTDPPVPVAESRSAFSSPLAAFGRFFAGLSLLSGLTMFACGVALLAWSWYGLRADLFVPGLLCAVGGQCGLLIGLALRPKTGVMSTGPAAEPEPRTYDHSLLLATLGRHWAETSRIDPPMASARRGG